MSKINQESKQSVASEGQESSVNIGGEALIEGVMMRGPERFSIAVRKSDGTIVVENRPYKAFSKRITFFGLPIIRGMVSFFESMIIGVKALMFSAQMFDIDISEQGENEHKIEQKVSDDVLKSSVIYFSVFLAMSLGILLFIMLPNFIAGLIKLPGDAYRNAILYNLIEGVVRITIFIVYIALVSNMKDIQRVFQYHGAEHKSIYCYEAHEPLTVENIKKYSRLHPRCGTSFMLQVMLISVIVFSFLGWPTLIARLSSRLIMIPLVAGISYEVIKYGAKSKSFIMRIVNAPGLALQRLTTREPDESQIEVAIEALKNATAK